MKRKNQARLFPEIRFLPNEKEDFRENSFQPCRFFLGVYLCLQDEKELVKRYSTFIA